MTARRTSSQSGAATVSIYTEHKKLKAYSGLVEIQAEQNVDTMLYHLHNHFPAVLYSVALLLLGGQLMSIHTQDQQNTLIGLLAKLPWPWITYW